MKKLVFAFIAFLLVGSVSAQDYEKSYKKARKALGTFNMDPSKTTNLEKAKELIDLALTGDLSGIKNPHDPYQVKGDIYNAIANSQVNAAQLAKQGGDVAAKGTPAVQADNAAMEAFTALSKAVELSSKSSQKKKAVKGLRESQTNLQNLGVLSYEAKDFEKAFSNFENVIAAHDLIKSNSGDSMLDGDGAYNDHLNLLGVVGVQGKKYDDVKPYLEQLYKAEYDDSFVYTALYAIGAQTDPEGAYQYLEAGRKKYPDDNGLLFEEINHFLKIGKLDELIQRLNKAIELEPDNVSLYTTLGNVYDNLYQKEVEAGNAEKEKEYFDNAYKHYSIAVEKDAKNVDAHYSMGALYFNKAALVTQEMLKLNDDYTKAGMKKFDGLKAQSTELFNQALPHFKKAESLNANDLNTLIALKEIFARIDDIEKSNEFKVRMETVQGGGTNDGSYFK